jgi:5-aminolevulinate synthase
VTDYYNEIHKSLDELKESGNYRYFLDVDKSALEFPHFKYSDPDGVVREATNWCSNDYLCMSVKQEVINAACETTLRSGTGSGGTRNISGTTVHHKALEISLARLHNKEAALVFGGAYLANLTTLSTLGKIFPEIVFISDEQNHASLIEGMRASRCEKIIFRHNDVAHVHEILSQLPLDQPKMLVFESVYSISGTVAPVRELVALAKEFNALIYIDEVHAVGLYNADGAGYAAQLGIADQIDIINGTLAKGFGVIGGYVAASKDLVDAIRSFGSGFIFTTSLPPATCAAAVTSVEILRNDPTLRDALHANVTLLRETFDRYGVTYRENPSHITPIPIGDSRMCKAIADRLLKEFGAYMQPINYPTVPRGEECLRVVATPRHTQEDMEHLAQSLATVLNELEVDLTVLEGRTLEGELH